MAPDLQSRLEAIAKSLKDPRIGVAISRNGEAEYAALGAGPADEPNTWRAPLGCITKLLTAALIEAEIAAARLSLSTPASQVLPDIDNVSVLAGATIGDLLNHTHGLDDSAFIQSPLTEDGLIDVEVLLDRVARRRLAPTGQLHSYSNLGAWILAAILERLNARPYAQQLQDNLFRPLGIATDYVPLEPRAPHTSICPSTGGALALSLADLLRFLEFATATRARSLQSHPDGDDFTPLSGWNAVERGVSRGWKLHSGGWYGHSSVWPDASALVRIEVRQRIAIAVTAGKHPASSVAGKLFPDVLTEYRSLSVPRPLPPDAVEHLERTPYCGDYSCAARTWSVCAHTRRVPLRLQGSGITADLIPAAHHVFFLRPAIGAVSFVQFLHREDESFLYLWDGRSLLSRSAVQDPSSVRPSISESA